MTQLMAPPPPHQAPAAGRYDAHWRRLQEERLFRTEQVAELESSPAASQRHESVRVALLLAATSALCEVEAALGRLAAGRYGICVRCEGTIPPGRLDVLPMAALCMPCHSSEELR